MTDAATEGDAALGAYVDVAKWKGVKLQPSSSIPTIDSNANVA